MGVLLHSIHQVVAAATAGPVAAVAETRKVGCRPGYIPGLERGGIGDSLVALLRRMLAAVVACRLEVHKMIVVVLDLRIAAVEMMAGRRTCLDCRVLAEKGYMAVDLAAGHNSGRIEEVAVVDSDHTGAVVAGSDHMVVAIAMCENRKNAVVVDSVHRQETVHSGLYSDHTMMAAVVVEGSMGYARCRWVDTSSEALPSIPPLWSTVLRVSKIRSLRLVSLLAHPPYTALLK